MRVFVTGTGRCGTVSFKEACLHITNYTTGHETPCGDLEYPDNSIEVSAHLRHCLPLLNSKYPNAKFVHLLRDSEPCINSLAALNDGRTMKAFHTLHPTVITNRSSRKIAERYYQTQTDVIRSQLAHIPMHQQKVMRLEKIKEQWPEFWTWIRAKGDYEAAFKSWDTPHNTTVERIAKAKRKKDK